jgi:hypothetical protein
MLLQKLTSAPRNVWRLFADVIRKIRSLRGRRQAIEGLRRVRGITLLGEWLSPEQRAQFDAFRYFDVIGGDTGRRYRIRHGTATNVHEIDTEGRPIMGWCFIPLGSLVAGDVMLAQKIALETNERAAIDIANRFPVQGG